jgi:hypothetical protein
MAEPPKLYGPHAPVIVSKTSDVYACASDNLKSLSGVLRKPKSFTIFFRAGSHYRDIAVLQQFIQIIYLRVKCGSIT